MKAEMDCLVYLAIEVWTAKRVIAASLVSRANKE